ncbi:MAG: hypothetical protein H7A25_22380 [Leptospiraceae bacterium]|nr:hypothetical protein [Leptospiraceae bacterium]MCP5502662.1 hypothetical protein [Leptospiraceae bacterium]
MKIFKSVGIEFHKYQRLLTEATKQGMNITEYLDKILAETIAKKDGE